MFFVYILKSDATNKHYVGFTSDLSKRLATHNSGGNSSTRTGRPWKRVFTEKFTDKRSAWLRERQIKKYKGGEAFKKLVIS